MTYLSRFQRIKKILDRRDYLVISLYLLAQVVLGLLDLIGVALIGLLGTLTINGITSQTPGSRIGQILQILQIDGFSFQLQVAIIGSTAGTLLISKTILSYFTARKSLHFLSKKGARISSALVSKFFKLPITEIRKSNQYEVNFALGNGATLLSVGVIGSFVLLVSDLILLTIISIGLFAVNPVTAVATYFYFMLIVLFLYLKMRNTARILGNQDTILSIMSNSRILGAINSYREIHAAGRTNKMAADISETREQLAMIQSRLTLLPSITKYSLESALVFGSIILCATHFLLGDAKQAFGILTLFLAAGSRIAPAALRIQQSAMQIKSSLGSVEPTLKLIEQLGLGTSPKSAVENMGFLHENFLANFEIVNVNYRYEGSPIDALTDITLSSTPGSFTAIVGESGSGKTTLVDVLLGLIAPQKGKVSISGMTPSEAIQMWPGAISYVPQEVYLIEGSILENVCLGLDSNQIDVSAAMLALKSANLEDWIKENSHSLQTVIGSGGLTLSGGQRQRIGIARALYSRPRLLILDEATSALDAITESEIAETLNNLRREVTLVVIAHRLSTVLRADNVAYMKDGMIVGQGTFEELKGLVPDFDLQAKLMGL